MTGIIVKLVMAVVVATACCCYVCIIGSLPVLPIVFCCTLIFIKIVMAQGARWHSGRASDSELKGPGFDSHRRHHVVSLSKTH